ncbi:MAG: hypothetical protein AAGN35_23720 [Bacteroidota bacterium]
MKKIEEIIDAIVRHGEDLNSGNSKAANKLNDQITKDTQEFVNRNGIDSLLPWLEHDNLNVKLWMAKSVYSEYPEKAVSTFLMVEKTQTIFAGSAYLFLDMHKKNLL